MKNSVLFAIVTYKEKYFECLSFLSLFQSFGVYGKGKLNVFIFDNTDFDEWNVTINEMRDVNINYFHQKDNRGISFAYNRIYDFAKNNNFEWIVFLDQDTTLPVETYDVYSKKALNDKQQMLAAPLVFSNEKIISPSKTNFYQKLISKPIVPGVLDLKNTTCINSGLMVATHLYGAVGGYNEKLKLDFCDHDFIDRAKKEVNSFEVLKLKFVQDFSSDNNTKIQSISRYKIFVKDYKNYSKTRNKLLLFIKIDLKHLLKLTYKFRTLVFIKIRIHNLVK
ncbi:hypothetical protein [Flavobacterium fluvii]|nr:hypothetical protein [Flavobacterium fluvii]